MRATGKKERVSLLPELGLDWKAKTDYKSQHIRGLGAPPLTNDSSRQASRLGAWPRCSGEGSCQGVALGNPVVVSGTPRLEGQQLRVSREGK